MVLYLGTKIGRLDLVVPSIAMSVLLRERFQETFLDDLKVHLRISSISKCTFFVFEDSLKDPQRYV